MSAPSADPSPDPPPGGGPDPGRLQRMRLLATGLLALMAALFVAASLAVRHWPAAAPAAAYVRAFAEAGVVGACADWFAVTALFRRPFGLPIPHTAVIPRNKDRIGQALGRFIAENFLTVQVLGERLRQVEVAAWGGEWLSRPDNAARLARRLAALAPELVQALPPGVVQEAMSATALAVVEATPAAPTASRLLAMIWSEGRAQGLLDRGAELLEAYLTEHEELVLEQVQSQTAKWLPDWVDRIIARKVADGAVRLLADVREPGHPWRARIAAAVEETIARLAQDPELRARGEALKAQLLADPQLQGHVRSLWSGIELRLGGELRGRANEIAVMTEHGLVRLGTWLQGEPRVQQALNLWARAMVRRVISPRRHEIGAFVAQVVSGWDARGVVEKLEVQVGPDLQFIRINGTLVGGLVGLALFALARALRIS